MKTDREDAWTGDPRYWMNEAQRAEFEKIRVRLDAELPSGPYLSKKQFADLIGKDVKTLLNDEAPTGRKKYPIPMEQGLGYSRSDVLDWLGVVELKSRMRRIHRCV